MGCKWGLQGGSFLPHKRVLFCRLGPRLQSSMQMVVLQCLRALEDFGVYRGQFIGEFLEQKTREFIRATRLLHIEVLKHFGHSTLVDSDVPNGWYARPFQDCSRKIVLIVTCEDRRKLLVQNFGLLTCIRMELSVSFQGGLLRSFLTLGLYISPKWFDVLLDSPQGYCWYSPIVLPVGLPWSVVGKTGILASCVSRELCCRASVSFDTYGAAT